MLRGLWRWREARAKQRDMPARKVLRDDLLIELDSSREWRPQTDGFTTGNGISARKTADPRIG
ncbi:MAG: hypothetical protein HC806_04650 [Anaerolineae bacterium]|nr:hypothetical protein [Anaerolineae bacterium]